jgi:hypothetical protein
MNSEFCAGQQTRGPDRGQLRRRQRRPIDRIASHHAPKREDPTFLSSEIQYELRRRAHEMAAGGLGSLLLVVDRIK